MIFTLRFSRCLRQRRQFARAVFLIAQLQGLQAIAGAVCPIVLLSVSVRQRIISIDVARIALQHLLGIAHRFVPQTGLHRRSSRITERCGRFRRQLVRFNASRIAC